MKRFLLVTASIGSGHEKAAAAIAAAIKARDARAAVTTVDFMSRKTSLLNAIMKSCYLQMLKLVPNLYEFMYQFAASKKQGGFLQLLIAKAMARNIKRLIRQHNPQVIICTHPFPAEAVSHLSKEWRKNFLSAAVITDYSVHQMWICPHMDLYFVGCEFMKKQLIAHEIREEIIHVTGIPVAEEFCREQDKGKCREQLKLDKGKPVILMMGGGLGLGRMASALEQLERIPVRLQILAVTGRNISLKQRAQELAAASKHSMRVIAYSDDIPLLMGAADVLVTKPGALTLTEAMSLHLPMVLHEPIPGPETDNARYMSGCGAAIWLHAGDSLAYVLQVLLAKPEQLAAMAESAAGQCSGNGAEKIVSIIYGNFT